MSAMRFSTHGDCRNPYLRRPRVRDGLDLVGILLLLLTLSLVLNVWLVVF